MDFQHSPRAEDYRERARRFIAEDVLPAEEAYLGELRALNHGADWTKWRVSPRIEELKTRARALGLWNLFLPDPKLGPGLSTLEYAPVAEETGRSLLAPEIFNCNAPDTGNMGSLWHCGTPEQKETWLTPLLSGEIGVGLLHDGAGGRVERRHQHCRHHHRGRR